VAVRNERDILPAYRGTPIETLLAYHNFARFHRDHCEAELLIGTCMDPRVRLEIPSSFAFILRCAGANLRVLEFDVSFAIAVAGIRSVCVIGHSECRMVDVASKREAFVSGLVGNARWDRQLAEEHFDQDSSRYDLGDVVSSVRREALWLRETYAGVTVAPLFYSLDDRSLYQVDPVQRAS
jgi:carbonic anhydrase